MSLYTAFDLGASNGRCVLGRFTGERLDLEVLHRFENGSVEINNHLYWDILSIYQQIKSCLIKLGREYRHELRGIGIDTWGCDFAFLDKQGKLIGNPYSYRDPQTAGMIPSLFARMSKEELFNLTGLQFIEPNTLVQIHVMQLRDDAVLRTAASFQHISDLMHYWLTGIIACEYTNASSSQLLNASTRSWAMPILEAFELPPKLFPDVVSPGTALGSLRAPIQSETGLDQARVIATATHDTAAAIVATPAETSTFAYISSGTWALLGVEIDEPVLTEQCLAYNIANEGGAFGKITLLKNIASLWLLQECRRQWELEGKQLSWDDLTEMAVRSRPFTAFIDPDDPAFSHHGNMPAKIQGYCQSKGQPIPAVDGEIIRTILESLALKYRFVLDRMINLTQIPVEVLHIIGGGSRNAVLNQFTANAVHLPVLAGPAEATALGNILVQMVAMGDLASLEEARHLVCRSFQLASYLPQDEQVWEEQYQRFLRTVGL